MNYEMLSAEKQRIFLDLAGKALYLRPALAEPSAGKELPEKIVEFAKILAASIAEPDAAAG